MEYVRRRRKTVRKRGKHHRNNVYKDWKLNDTVHPKFLSFKSVWLWLDSRIGNQFEAATSTSAPLSSYILLNLQSQPFWATIKKSTMVQCRKSSVYRSILSYLFVTSLLSSTRPLCPRLRSILLDSQHSWLHNQSRFSGFVGHWWWNVKCFYQPSSKITRQLRKHIHTDTHVFCFLTNQGWNW